MILSGSQDERDNRVELRILVGTMTGTAEAVAKDIEQVLSKAGHRTDIVLMDGRDASVFNRNDAQCDAYLICTSTYGSGDVPDNAQRVFASLEETRPDLSGIVYGVIALGDQTYGQTFCQGGLRFDKLLSELGGQRAGRCCCTMPARGRWRKMWRRNGFCPGWNRICCRRWRRGCDC